MTIFSIFINLGMKATLAFSILLLFNPQLPAQVKTQYPNIPRVDDPANEPMFARMEELGILAASLHIADPNGPFGNRTPWCADPVEYWREITALYHVLAKHPDLEVVAAHASWLICQDAQIDYLRFLLSTFPNFNVDLAATFHYFHMVKAYNRCFRILETADIVNGGFFGDTPTKGLALPEEVLEKIYYKNAIRLYPGLEEALANVKP